MDSLYRVIGWDDNFENSKSRERQDCSFVCVPNGQSGLGFNRIMSRKDGAAIYGIWCLILGALSRQRRRDKKGREGWLTHDGHSTGTPWTPDDLSLLWRRPKPEIETALEFLSSPLVGWIMRIEHVDTTMEALDARAVPAQCPSGIVKEGIEGSELKEEKEPQTPEPKEDKHSGYRLRLGGIFKRKASTEWSDKELKKFAALNPDRLAFEQELSDIEAYYQLPSNPQIWPREDLVTLMNNWNTELDRAYKHIPRQQELTRTIEPPKAKYE